MTPLIAEIIAESVIILISLAIAEIAVYIKDRYIYTNKEPLAVGFLAAAMIFIGLSTADLIYDVLTLIFG